VRTILAILILSVTCAAQSTVLDSSRYEQWARANVGVSGGIPSASYTQCVTSQCNTVTSAGASATATQINAALASAPSNTYVLLPAGTYNSLGSSGICLGAVCGNSMNKNVALRGSGANSTFLVPTAIGPNCGNGRSANICMGDTSIFPGGNNTMPPCGGAGSTHCATWASGYAQGATTITISGVGTAGILNGDYIVLDQGNSTTDSGGLLSACNTYVGQAGASFICSQEGAGGQGRCTGGSGCPNSGTVFEADHQQWVQVVSGCSTSCNGAGPYTLTITPGLYGTDWNVENPVYGVWFPGAAGYKGVENLSIDNNTAGSQGNFSMYNCPNCWVKNVRSMNSIRSHVTVFLAPRAEVRDSYFYRTQNGTNQSYGIEYGEPSGCDQLFENNIFQQISSPLVGGGGCGVVAGYNFSISDNYNPSTYGQGTYPNHDANNVFNLYEGNIFNNLDCDAIHGSGGVNTIFRNWLNGYDWNQGGHPVNQIMAVDLDAYCRGYNIIGNVLGTPGIHNIYQTATPSAITQTTPSVYVFGYANGVLGSFSGMSNDTLAASTSMRWGNYDVVNGTVRWNSTEAAPGATTYLNANFTTSYFNSLAHTLPDSFYYSSKPSWWGTMAWPPIGPDVTSGNGGYYASGTYSAGICPVGKVDGGATCSNSTIGGYVNINPAMSCYFNVMGGPSDGTGSALSFDASSCYAASGSSNEQSQGIKAQGVTIQ